MTIANGVLDQEGVVFQFIIYPIRLDQ